MRKIESLLKIFGSKHMLALRGILLDSKYVVNQQACVKQTVPSLRNVRSSVLLGGSDVFVAVTPRMSVNAFTPGAKCRFHWLECKH